MFCSSRLLLPTVLFDQLGERISAGFVQHGAQVRVSAKVRQEIVAVSFSQGIYAPVTALAVNFPVFVAMASVQARLFDSRDPKHN
jgi:hypothetical protein